MLISLLISCITVPTPSGEFRVNSQAPGPMRVVVFPTTCEPADTCSQLRLGRLDGTLAQELEFDGYTLIDGVSLVAEARTREDGDASLKLLGEELLRVQATGQEGSLFVDLPPEARRALLKEARADGVLRTTVRMGAMETNSGVAQYRLLTAQAKLGVGEDESNAWVARCSRMGSRIDNVNRHDVKNFDVTLDWLGTCLVEQIRSS